MLATLFQMSGREFLIERIERTPNLQWLGVSLLVRGWKLVYLSRTFLDPLWWQDSRDSLF